MNDAAAEWSRRLRGRWDCDHYPFDPDVFYHVGVEGETVLKYCLWPVP